MYLDQLKKNEYFWLILIVLGAFLIRFWFLDDRWINPDEGAQLMDGRLALGGLIPLIDFDSRQPLYVYITASVLEVFEPSYIVGRFIPLVSTLGTIIVVFLISKKMFDKRVALLSSAIYAFLPFSIFWSIMVHMQPISVLLNCIGVYCLVSYIKSEKNIGILVLGGIFFALAYYVRETSLAMLIATFFYFLAVYYKRIKSFMKNYVAVLVGFFLVCVGAFALYSRLTSLSKVWDSSINPFDIVIDNLYEILLLIGIVSPSVEIASTSTENVGNFRLDDQNWDSTLGELVSTFHFNSFLYVGLLFSVLVLVYLLFIRNKDEKHIREEVREASHSIYLLYSWLFSLAAFYSYWILYRGFYMQYFEEFLPPLIILFAFVVVYSLSQLRLERDFWKKALTIGSLSVTVFVIHNKFLQGVELNSVIMGLYVLLTIPILAAFWFFPRLNLQRCFYASLAYLGLAALSLFLLKETYQSPYFVRGILYLALLALIYFTIFVMSRVRLKEDLWESLGFIFVSLLVSTFLLSFALSGYHIHLGFSSTWSPRVVKEVSEYIRLNSSKNAEVMSGGVIWELEAGHKPFMNLSHPTAFRSGIPKEMFQSIERHLRSSPPEFIVLDGYTEQTYLRHIEELQGIMDRKYQLKKTVDYSSRYPVEVYELMEGKNQRATK